ncbi:MAG: hypothetical protein J6Q54_02810 [Oscillospiraceae bacterium]|nr:hypothetical protein [Oscillospiraceae bacterium]
MKKIQILALICLLAFCVSMMFGCSSRNMKEELPGEWFVWHWYYNTEGGEDGFFEEAKFYTFDAEGNITIKEGETVTTATYTFTGKDTIDVVFEDGTTDTFQLIPSERNGVKQIQFMNVNTIYTITLEPMSSWTE